MDTSKCVSATASTMRGIALLGVASAIITALFAALATKLLATAVISAAGAAWWGVCSGLAWVLCRKAEGLQRDAESRPLPLPRRRNAVPVSRVEGRRQAV